MRQIELDATGWMSADDFYHALLTALGAPDWHGRNIDALWDSVVTGGINEVEPPFAITVRGWPTNDSAGLVLQRFVQLIRDAEADGVAVTIRAEDDNSQDRCG